MKGKATIKVETKEGVFALDCLCLIMMCELGCPDTRNNILQNWIDVLHIKFVFDLYVS